MQDEQPPSDGKAHNLARQSSRVSSYTVFADPLPETLTDEQRIEVLEGQISYLLKAVQRLEGDHQ